MGAAKRRGSFDERKAKPLGRQSNHAKGHADLGIAKYTMLAQWAANRREAHLKGKINAHPRITPQTERSNTKESD